VGKFSAGVIFLENAPAEASIQSTRRRRRQLVRENSRQFFRWYNDAERGGVENAVQRDHRSW